jgi:RNA polymerase sigma-70 factor (ECF subfamily)
MTTDVYELEEFNRSVARTRGKSARSDEALMYAVQHNDARAFEALYDRHYNTVFWLAMRILDDRELAADASQEAFTRLWRHRSLYQPGRGRLKWWLQGIVRNGAIDLLHREHAVGPLTEEVFELGAPDSIEAEVLAGDEQRELACLLEQLPSKQREVIELAYFAGLSHAEITQRLGLPLGTIKGRIRLALEKLRQSLPSDGNAEPPQSRSVA